MQRLYYSISEVAKILDEETYVLRYWEKEFPQISPKKNRSGKRIYSERDLDILKIIKKLLREDKLSIQGAKEQMAKFNLSNNVNLNLFEDNINENNNQKSINNTNKETLNNIKKQLLNLLSILDQY